MYLNCVIAFLNSVIAALCLWIILRYGHYLGTVYYDNGSSCGTYKAKAYSWNAHTSYLLILLFSSCFSFPYAYSGWYNVNKYRQGKPVYKF